MANRFHLTDQGPKPCSVDPANPKSRGCSYSQGGHYGELSEAESAFAEQMGGVVPGALKSPESTVLAESSKLTEAEAETLQLYRESIDEETLDFPDHSGLADDEFATLAELRARPELLANNCHAVSLQLAEDLAGGDEEVELLSVLYRDGYSHHAVSIRRSDGQEIVLDYTAAQYDSSLPIPFVAERSKWEDAIESRVLRKHGTTIAAVGIESEGPLLQGPPVPQRFFHVARKSDAESILATGLTPSIGERSENLGEDAPRVYLFDSRISAEDGIASWMGDEFDEDEELVLLSVDPAAVARPKATYVYEDETEENGFGPSTEWTSERAIPRESILIVGTI